MDKLLTLSTPAQPSKLTASAVQTVLQPQRCLVLLGSPRHSPSTDMVKLAEEDCDVVVPALQAVIPANKIMFLS